MRAGEESDSVWCISCYHTCVEPQSAARGKLLCLLYCESIECLYQLTGVKNEPRLGVCFCAENAPY